MSAYSFDSECLTLARHFYPGISDTALQSLAQQFQMAVEDFIFECPVVDCFEVDPHDHKSETR